MSETPPENLPSSCSPRSSGCLRLRRLLLAWLPVLVWMVVIYLFSDQPYSGRETGKYLGSFNVPVRKLGHVTEYAILFLLCRRAWAMSFISNSLANIATVAGLAIAVSYALSDEWHQSFVPGRSATINDVLVDGSGCLLALALRRIAARMLPT